MKPPVKLEWLEQAIEIHRFHISQLKDETHWTVRKTAKSLNRSVGAVSQYIVIGSWVKTHEKQLRKCSGMEDAIAWIRNKQKEMKLDEID